MAELMNREDFRAALEEAIKGKSANKAPFSVAWASGKLTRAHLARWAENHYHYVARSRITWATSTPVRRTATPKPRISCSPTCMRKRSAATATPTC